jgi:hypothetical protein
MQLKCFDNFTMAMTTPYIGLNGDVSTGSLLQENDQNLGLAKLKAMEVQLKKAKLVCFFFIL